MCIKIAKAEPFTGAPKIQMPSLYGIPTGKKILYRVPVTGERPIDIQVTGIPDDLRFENGILTGSVAEDKEFTITVKAENKLGSCEKEILCRVGEDVMLLTPLMGTQLGTLIETELVSKWWRILQKSLLKPV